jgi:hypothetical protein
MHCYGDVICTLRKGTLAVDIGSVARSIEAL